MKRIRILPLLVFSGLTLAGCASTPSEEPSPPTPDEPAARQERLAVIPADVDLQITSLTVSCGAVGRQTCFVNVTVSNDGSDAAEGFSGRCVYVYGSRDDQDHPLRGRGGSRAYSFVWDGYVAGKSRAAYTASFRPARRRSFHALDCVIDPNNVIPETNEGNNWSSRSINRVAGS
ncbi:MAG: CARDB domain-containing protein [Planctomycetota bacterium]|jgi:subtilase family serine protease